MNNIKLFSFVKTCLQRHGANQKPAFPDFKKIELNDKNLFESYTSMFPPYSDYNFVSLWSYDTKSKAEFPILNNNLVIKYYDYITLEPFYSFIGNNKPLETTNTLIDLSKKMGLSPCLKLVPKHNIEKDWDSMNKEYKIVEDRDNHDYIVSIKSLVELKGNKNYSHRNLVRRFAKGNPDHIVKRFSLKKDKLQADIESLFRHWGKEKKSDEIENEFKALKRLIRAARSGIDLEFLGIYLDKRLIGFSIDELLKNGYVISHFGKADRSYTGIYKYIEHVNAKYFYAKGYKYINYEQDLGIPGLKKTKELWHPIKYLEKYTIREKE